MVGPGKGEVFYRDVFPLFGEAAGIWLDWFGNSVTADPDAYSVFVSGAGIPWGIPIDVTFLGLPAHRFFFYREADPLDPVTFEFTIPSDLGPLGPIVLPVPSAWARSTAAGASRRRRCSTSAWRWAGSRACSTSTSCSRS